MEFVQGFLLLISILTLFVVYMIYCGVSKYETRIKSYEVRLESLEDWKETVKLGCFYEGSSCQVSFENLRLMVSALTVSFEEVKDVLRNLEKR